MANKQLIQLIAQGQAQKIAQQQKQQQQIQALQAEYDNWSKQQDIAQLQAEYDAWNQANPVQPAPVQSAPVQKQKEIPSLKKAPVVNMEDYMRQQQEEQMQSANISDEERAAIREKQNRKQSVNDFVNAMNSRDLKAFNKLDNGQTLGEAQKVAADNQKRLDEVSNIVEESMKDYASPFTFKGQKWQNPYENMTDEQKAVVRDYVKKNKDNPNLTDAEKQRLRDFSIVYGRSGESNGSAQTAYNNTRSDLGKTLQAAAAGFVDFNAPIANLLWKVASKIPGLNKIDQEEAQKAYENYSEESKALNPTAANVGRSAGQIYDYLVTAPVANAAAGAANLGKAGGVLLNQGVQAAQDLALDIVPEANRMQREDGQIDYGELAKRGLTDVGMNAVMEAIPMLGAMNYDYLAKNVGNNADILKNLDATGALKNAPDIVRSVRDASNFEDIDNAVRNATDQANNAARRIDELSSQIPKVPRPIDEAYNSIPTLEDDVLNANNNQFRELMNNYNSQFKDTSSMKNIYSPEDLDASMNNQLKSLMDENLIPERVNPVAEMEPVEIPQIESEIRAMNNELSNMWGGVSVDTKGARPHAVNQGVSPSIENAAEDISRQMDVAQRMDNAPQRTIKNFVDNPELTSTANQKVNDELFLLEAPFNDPRVLEAASNVAGKVQSDAGFKLMDDYATLSQRLRDTVDDEAEKVIRDQLAEMKGNIKTLDKAEQAAVKDMIDFADTETAVADYKKALNGNDVDAIDRAAKNLDNVRNRLARRKGADKALASNFSGSYGPLVKRPKQAYLDKGNVLDEELAKEWFDYDNANTNRFVRDAEPDTALKGSTPEGAYNLQHFGNGGDEWATSKLRTNSMNKTGLINDPNDIPMSDYAYRKYGAEEQRMDFGDRYAGSKDVVRDLVEKDAFDEVDMRGAASTWRDLMESGTPEDIRKANRLGKKMSVEGREGGRLIEAIKEMNRNSPDGMVQEAQDVIGQAVDKRVGKGTSESLDNLYEKVAQAYDDAKTKDDFMEKVKELLDGDLKKYASPKTAKNMQSKQIKGAKKILDMINNAEDLSKVPIDDVMQAIYKSNGGVALSPTAQKEVYDLLKQASQYDNNSYEFRALQARAARRVMAEVPSGLGDWIRAFLYDNMLGNFKTAFSRNFMGNVAYQTLEKVRELPTAAVDWATSKVTGKRSALGWNADKAKAYAGGFKKGAVEQAKDTFSTGANTARSGDNSWADALKSNRTVNNDAKKLGHFANEVDRYVESVMKFGDRPIYEANYAEFKTELEQMLNRYGKNGVAGLENVEDKYLAETIDNLAKVRAADAVFQKQGHVSKGLTELRDGLGDISRGAFGVDILSTAASPFTLTPGNMAERALEYTPIGAVKNAIETGIELNKGTFNQRRFAEEAGRTLTGLPVLAGAYLGAKNGLVNGGLSTDPDERQAQLDDGFIEYGLNVPEGIPVLGGKQLDTSDLPVYGPFMQAGAVMNEEGLSPKASLQAAEAVLGGSSMQGIRRAFGADSGTYSSQDSIVENLVDTVKSSATQFVPSLIRQTAQATDKYKRDLGEYRTNEYYLNSIKNSIPGLRETLPIKTDVEGEPILQNQGRGGLSKALESYVLPMNMSEYEPSPLNKEASRLFEATDKAWAFQPKALRKDLRQWDEKSGKEYTERQFRQYKQDLGKKNAQIGNALLDSKYYKGLDDEAKVEAMQSVYSAMKSLAKENVTGIESDDKIVAAYKKNKEEGVINYLQGKSIVDESGISKSSNAAKEAMELAEQGKFRQAQKVVDDYAKYKEIADEYDVSNGYFISSDSAQEIKDKIAAGDVSGAKQLAKQQSELKAYGFSADTGLTNYNKAKSVIPGLTTKEFATTYKSMDANGKNGISQTEFLDYLNSQNITPEMAQQYLDAYGGWENKKGQKKKLVGSSGHYELKY